MTTDRLYALDFDGVICDSAIETGFSGWHAARTLWPDMPQQMPEDVLSEFRRIRPVLETGYEAIIICKGLLKGLTANHFLQDFSYHIDTLMQQEKCTVPQLKLAFAQYRDQWIASDLPGWIEMNPLYEGILKLLQNIPAEQLFIITTKQERFVHAILSSHGLDLPASQVFGMDRQLKKTQILTTLKREFPDEEVFFLEDRLPTLLNVLETPALASLQLGFAAWGYNTEADRQMTHQHHRITYFASPETLNLS